MTKPPRRRRAATQAPAPDAQSLHSPKLTLEIMSQDPGKGVSDSFADRAFWLKDIDPMEEPWLDALCAADDTRETHQLVTLLRSGATPSRRVMAFLANFLERHSLRRRPGKPPTPAYDLTPVEAALAMAVDEVRSRRPGVSLNAAVTEAAQRRGLDEQTVLDAHRGRLGSIRRAHKRLAT